MLTLSRDARSVCISMLFLAVLFFFYLSYFFSAGCFSPSFDFYFSLKRYFSFFIYFSLRLPSSRLTPFSALCMDFALNFLVCARTLSVCLQEHWIFNWKWNCVTVAHTRTSQIPLLNTLKLTERKTYSKAKKQLKVFVMCKNSIQLMASRVWFAFWCTQLCGFVDAIPIPHSRFFFWRAVKCLEPEKPTSFFFITNAPNIYLYESRQFVAHDDWL